MSADCGSQAGAAERINLPVSTSSGAPLALAKLPAVQGAGLPEGQTPAGLRLGLEGSFPGSMLTLRVNPSLRACASSRSAPKPPQLPHARPPSLRLASEPLCREGQERSDIEIMVYD
ncbi:hypothetical protein NN561_007059 [Cricetulus griseus]